MDVEEFIEVKSEQQVLRLLDWEKDGPAVADAVVLATGSPKGNVGGWWPLVGYITRAAFGSGEGLERMQFYVPNIDVRVGQRRGRTFFGLEMLKGLLTEAQGWQIIFEDLPRLSEVIDRLRADRGYGLTHRGEIRRADGSTFSLQECDSIRDAISITLAMVRGSWASPMLWAGKARDGSAFHFWVHGRVDGWASEDSWFPSTTPGWMRPLLAAVVDNWDDAAFRETVSLATHWYIQALNEHYIPSRIALAQVGAEFLAWTLAARTSGLTAKRFDDLDAGERVGLLLSRIGLPSGIPSRFTALAKAFPRTSGPEAIARLRNRYAHPSPRNRRRLMSVPSAAQVEATELAVHYLERGLLHLVGYKGALWDRAAAQPGSV